MIIPLARRIFTTSSHAGHFPPARIIFLLVCFITFLGRLGVGTVDGMEHVGGTHWEGNGYEEDKSSWSYLFSSYGLLLQLSTEKSY